MLPVAAIRPGDNYRQDFDETYISGLAQQIDELGLLHAITVRTDPKDSDRYVIVAGECRWRAHQVLGRDEIRAMVRDDLTDSEASLAMLVENDARRELNPIDQGFSYRHQIETFDRSVEELAEAIGRRPGYVRDRLALLDLTASVVGAVRSGSLPHTTALRLVGLDGNRQRIAMREYLANPDMTAEQWQRRIEALRAEQAREAQTELVPEDFLSTEVYEPVLTPGRAPGKVGLARLLQRVLSAHDEGLAWTPGLDAEVRHAVDAVVSPGAEARRAAAYKAWGTMRRGKAG